MTGRTDGGRALSRVPAPRRELPVEVLESKLFRPTIRPSVIPRPDLVAALDGDHSVPVVAITAPAGYGKTTLLALWADTDDRPFAWLSIDPQDNDPVVFLTHLAAALDRVDPLPSEVVDVLHSGGIAAAAT